VLPTGDGTKGGKRGAYPVAVQVRADARRVAARLAALAPQPVGRLRVHEPVRIVERHDPEVVVVQERRHVRVALLVPVDELVRQVLDDERADPLARVHRPVPEDDGLLGGGSRIAPEVEGVQVAALVRLPEGDLLGVAREGRDDGVPPREVVGVRVVAVEPAEVRERAVGALAAAAVRVVYGRGLGADLGSQVDVEEGRVEAELLLEGRDVAGRDHELEGLGGVHAWVVGEAVLDGLDVAGSGRLDAVDVVAVVADGDFRARQGRDDSPEAEDAGSELHGCDADEKMLQHRYREV
jgi:hypothetical protein